MKIFYNYYLIILIIIIGGTYQLSSLTNSVVKTDYLAIIYNSLNSSTHPEKSCLSVVLSRHCLLSFCPIINGIDTACILNEGECELDRRHSLKKLINHPDMLIKSYELERLYDVTEMYSAQNAISIYVSKTDLIGTHDFKLLPIAKQNYYGETQTLYYFQNGRLKSQNVKILDSNQQCYIKFKTKFPVGDQQVCINHKDFPIEDCCASKGVIASPTEIIGTMAWSTSCGGCSDCYESMVFTNLIHYNDWIKSHIDIYD